MLKIYKDTEKVLHEKCIEISMPLDKEYIDLGKQMIQHLKESQDDEFAAAHDIRAGVGLAAPQIGKAIKMFAIYLDDTDGKHYEYVLVNPRLKSISAKKCYLRGGEGCLSVDGVHKGLVERPYRIKMAAYDILQGKDVVVEAKGYLAIALQHEFDHLNGILFYDHFNPIDPMRVSEGSVEI